MGSGPVHLRQIQKASIYRLFLLLLTILLAALTQSGCASSSGNLVSPRTLNFGNVVVGSSSKQSLTLTNSGTSALTVTQAVATGKGFAVAGPALPLMLHAGQGATFTTIFTPTQAGTASGSVSITSSAETPGAPRPTGGSAPPAVTTQVETVAVSGAGVSPAGPLQITSGALPNAQVGVPFQASLAATGGVQPYHWTVTTGTLPSGLSLGADTGVISGTTTQGGKSGFSVQVSDSSSPAPQTAMKVLTLSILAFALQINSGGLPNGQVGGAYQGSVSGTGGVTPYTWSVIGALPAGLSLNSSSGAVTGTPTQAATSSFTINLTDAAQQTAQMPFSVTIAAAGTQPPAGKVVITPSVPPAVNQGATFQFTANAAVTWSCPGCAGSINPATGVYTAPPTVTAQQSYGGYQVLPNNSIYNTRIDSAPVDPNSATWVALNNCGPGCHVPLTYDRASFMVNYVDGTTPIQNIAFFYTPLNNGPFQITPYPDAKMEGGALIAPFSGTDRHFLSIDKTSGTFQEMYNYYTAGTANSEGCPSCTSQSGLRYSNSSYALSSGGTDAAGLYIMPLTLHLQELRQALATGGAINHALRMTMSTGFTANTFRWPATQSTTNGGQIPFGVRIRLKASFDDSAFSPIAKILIKQLKQYGLIMCDNGEPFAIQIERTAWPPNYRAALDEITSSSVNMAMQLEYLDESGLQLSSSSTEVNTNRETVVATRNSDSATASVDVVLVGMTVGLPHDLLNIQAGTPGQQFEAFAHGGNTNAVTWTMSPTVGTLTSSGFYTPPATIGSVTSTIVTATSVDNPGVAAAMTLNVFPPGAIRIVAGPTPYTDSFGNVWAPGMVGNDGGYPYDNTGGPWPNTPDITLYKVKFNPDGGDDARFDFTVPNGQYQITGKFGDSIASGVDLISLEAQGQIFFSNTDIGVAAGGAYKPIDLVLPAVVTNGKLSFVVRRATGGVTMISALQIAPVH